MKKRFSALLAAVFILTSLFLLSGCGSSTAGSTASAADSTNVTETAEAAAASEAQAEAAGTQQESQPAAGSTAEAGNSDNAGNTADAGQAGTAAAEPASAAESAPAAAGQDAPAADAAEVLTTEQIAEYAQTSYNDLASAIMVGIQDGWQSVTTESLGISAVYAANPESTFGFSIQDLNGDGIPELLLGETVNNDASSPIYDIFTADNAGALIHVFSGDENSRCFLYENGTLANLTEDGVFFHYVLENNMLVADDSGESGGNYVDIAFTYFTVS